MNDNPMWEVAHLDDMERRDKDIPCASTSGSAHSESVRIRPAMTAR